MDRSLAVRLQAARTMPRRTRRRLGAVGAILLATAWVAGTSPGFAADPAAAGSAGGTSSDVGQPNATIKVGDDGFKPGNVTVMKGAVITFTGTGTVVHTATTTGG